MEDFARNLILAGEISGFLHDLGKLHPGFAEENLKGGDNLSNQSKKQTEINAAHGAILETGRIYPSAEELAQNQNLQDCLDQLLKHEGWAGCLKMPEAWLKTPSVQTSGLGAALRQHHATNDWPESEASLLGDLYAMGADIRDSALDKASGGTQKSKQSLSHAGIADTFGQAQQCYSPETLKNLWQQIPDQLAVLWKEGAWENVADTRKKLYQRLDGLFLKALGETRRPTNDVTLRHHSFSTASHFKAALAEGVLRYDFSRWVNKKGLFDVGQMGLIRFRLLGIRWSWRELTRQAFRPVTLVSLTERRDELIAAIRQKVEVEYPVGNILYQDDDGILILAPGFYEADADESERLFARHILDPLQDALTGEIETFFGPGTSYRLFWSEPTLYLTDYPEALGFNPDSCRQRFAQAGVTALHELWQQAPTRHAGSQIQICPQCGLRPAPTREFELVESSLTQQSLCDFCETLHANEAQEDRRKNAKTLFGFTPPTFNLQEIVKRRGQGNSRVALISVQVDTQALASGNALVTQLARPVSLLEENKQHWSANELGDWFEQLLVDLRNDNKARLKSFERVKSENEKGKKEDSKETKQVRELIGDRYWLNERDGRVMGKNIASNALQIAREFYFRETLHLPKELKLYRHDGDRLALFAQRKHPSPARLQRLWDDLRALWTTALTEIAGLLGDAVIPLSLDAGGVRFLVAARDATAVIESLQHKLEQRLNKVRGGFAPQVSCLVFREKFPLYLGLDALYRMEARIPRLPHQAWTVKHVEQDKQTGSQQIIWQTPQGDVNWNVDLSTGDPEQIDLWHPHVIRSHDASGAEIEGPDRITHVTALKAGDTCLIPPATFDFMVLEGGVRRYQIVYEERERQLHRPHLVFGQHGQAVGLLERFEAMASLVERTGWHSSQVKGLQGEMVELYEKWVRDVPEPLRETGVMAWRTHVEAMLKRYLPKQEQAGLRAEMLAAVLDGRFFDAVEWSTFIGKGGETG